MKLVFLIYVCLVVTLFADDPEFQKMRKWSLEEKIDFVQSFSKDERAKNWEKGMKALKFHFSERYSTQWTGNYGGLEEIREQVEEIRPLIMELGYSGVEPHRFYAVGIGKYLKIDNEVKEMLYHVLDESVETPGQSKDATLDVIFGYDLETPDLKSELLKELSLDQKIAKNAKYQGGTYLYAGRWGLAEAAPLLIDLLEKHYAERKNAKHGALQALKELGPVAVKVLPRIKALYEQRKKDGDAEFREIEALEFAIQRISKEADSHTNNQRESIPREISRFPLKKTDTEKSAATKQLSKSPINWLLIIAGVLVLGSLTLLFKARKDKSTP